MQQLWLIGKDHRGYPRVTADNPLSTFQEELLTFDILEGAFDYF